MSRARFYKTRQGARRGARAEAARIREDAARIREDAAILCNMMANLFNRVGLWFVPPCAALGIDCRYGEAAKLARSALWSLPQFDGCETHLAWAEAEALLRDGWEPGDDVEVRS